VTRHDALISVRAGFQGTEISELWPRAEALELEENNAGIFSHRFMAKQAASL
jgi:hypothetical protein